MEDRTERREPYMGMVSVRHRSGMTFLHGSDVRHYHTIALSISEGVEVRNLNENRYHDGGRYIEIEMTPLQWLELITNPNTGCGTPCTLHWVRGVGRIEGPKDPEVEIDKAHREFQVRAGRLPEELAELSQMVEDLKVSKQVKKTLGAKISRVQTELRSNMPFAFEQFKEATERLLAEAKATAETYIGNVLFRLGLKSAKNLELGLSEEKTLIGEEGEKA